MEVTNVNVLYISFEMCYFFVCFFEVLFTQPAEEDGSIKRIARVGMY